MIKNIPDWLVSRLKIEAYPSPERALGERVIGVIPEARQCEYCNHTVYEQTINIVRQETPRPHWRSHCTACRRYRNPDTGLYDMLKADIDRYYTIKNPRRDK